MKITESEISEIAYTVIFLSITIGLAFSVYITAITIGVNFNDQPAIKWSIELGMPVGTLILMNLIYLKISERIFKD